LPESEERDFDSKAASSFPANEVRIAREQSSLPKGQEEHDFDGTEASLLSSKGASSSLANEVRVVREQSFLPEGSIIYDTSFIDLTKK